MIDLTKRYRTKRGEKVIIDDQGLLGGKVDVSGAIQYPQQLGADIWHADGKSHFMGESRDLVEDIGGLQTYIWVNVYMRDESRMEIDAHLTRELADELCAPGRIACIRSAVVGGHGTGLTAKDFTYSFETEG